VKQIIGISVVRILVVTMMGSIWSGKFSHRAYADAPQSGVVVCPGEYPRHVQGVCMDREGNLYWSFTTELVKTDAKGQLLLQIPVANHHGDLCAVDGKIFVAVNLGKFNQPAGKADSWVYEYDAKTLELLGKHDVQEVVHGAGGIAWHDGKFLVVGGLPKGTPENYLYEYDANWKFLNRHVLASGETYLGIQTVTFHGGHWWLGCYGTPQVLLKASEDFRFEGKQEFNGSVGLIGLSDGTFLIAQNKSQPNKHNRAKLVPAIVNSAGEMELVSQAKTLK